MYRHIQVGVFSELLDPPLITQSTLISALPCLVIRLLLYRVPRIDLLDGGVTCWGQPRTSIPFLELCPLLNHNSELPPAISHRNRVPSCLLPRIYSTKVCFTTRHRSTTSSILLGRFFNHEIRPNLPCLPVSLWSPKSLNLRALPNLPTQRVRQQWTTKCSI